jgi:hypothetical protein
MPGKDSNEGGGFTQGSPTEDECGTSKFGELVFGFFGEVHLPEGHGSEEDLLGEVVRLSLGAPISKMMGFALEQPEHRRKQSTERGFGKSGGLRSRDPLSL